LVEERRLMPLPHRIEVHVVPRNHRWEVEAGGVTRRYIDWLCTKERALEHAVERGRELSDGRDELVVVVVERSDGSVERALHAEELLAPAPPTH
jgi:hypothetical protein